MSRSALPTILMASNPDNLRAALAAINGPTATVEAEYGDAVVEGTNGGPTLAHHGPRKANPSPCLRGNEAFPGLRAIGLSHVDLDALGGVLSLLGRKPGPDGFWSLAAFVDVNGPHRMRHAPDGAQKRFTHLMHAFWAWSETHRLYPPRDGSVVSANEWVEQAEDALHGIFGLFGVEAQDALLAAGAKHRANGEALNRASIVAVLERRDNQGAARVAVRKAAAFCNHLYNLPEGLAGDGVVDGVVAFNPEAGSITVSLESPRPGVSCREIVQRLWGPLAGGHDGIAGSPRDQQMDPKQADAAANALLDALYPLHPAPRA